MFVAGGEEGSTIKVKKTELLEKLLDNRRTHMEEYATAYKAYRKTVELALVRKLREVRHSKEEFNLYDGLNLPAPEDHTEDYDRVIAMLNMCTSEEVFISEQEFTKYAMDNWGWKNQFQATNATYSIGKAYVKKR